MMMAIRNGQPWINSRKNNMPNYRYAFFSFLFLCAQLFAQKNYSCINEKGTTVFNFSAEYVNEFSEGLAAFQKLVNNQWLWGFVNKSGEIVMEPTYEKVKDFRFGCCWVKPVNGDFVLINKTGQVISEKSYKKVGIFMEEMCAVYDDLKMGFINAEGKEVLPCIYTGSPAYSDGLVCLCKADATTELYGFFDKTGKQVIPFKFKQGGFSNFYNGECRVQVNGKTSLINKKGEVVFTPALSNNMEAFKNGLAMSYTKPGRTGVGYFNRQNKWIVQPVYENGKSFENGFAVVKLKGKFGVIDTLGKTIIPFEYESIYANAITDGFFVCENGSTKTYLNATGKPFTQLSIEYVLSRKSGSLLPYKSPGGKMGYLFGDGTIAIKPIYNKAFAFSDELAWVLN